MLSFLKRLSWPYPLPVIVISFNRGAFLTRVIESYRRQTVALDIWVHDNGSDDPDTLRALEHCARQGCTILRYPPIREADDLDGVDATVQAAFAQRPRGPYAVSDCDVDLAEADPGTIAVYLRLLRQFPAAQCVGPMLRIDDIPQSYPLFGRVMNRHIEQFWGRRPRWTSVGGKQVAYQEAAFDTTFAVHRAGTPFRRLKTGLRVYRPFEARHLDWYPAPHDLASGPGAYSDTASPRIAHWNSRSHVAEFAAEACRFDTYVVVTTGPGGRLREELRHVADNPA